MSLSEGNAKTGLEQSPVTDSRKVYGPHKSTVTTHRKSVQSVQSVQSVVKEETPILWRTALQAEYHIGDYPGTPPPSVYQVTHGTALQAAECDVNQPSSGVLPSRLWSALIMHVRRCMEGSEKKGAAICSPFMVNSMMSYQ